MPLKSRIAAAMRGLGRSGSRNRKREAAARLLAQVGTRSSDADLLPDGIRSEGQAMEASCLQVY